VIAGSGLSVRRIRRPAPAGERETGGSGAGDRRLAAPSHTDLAVAPWLRLPHPAQQVRRPRSVCGGAGWV